MERAYTEVLMAWGDSGTSCNKESTGSCEGTHHWAAAGLLQDHSLQVDVAGMGICERLVSGGSTRELSHDSIFVGETKGGRP